MLSTERKLRMMLWTRRGGPPPREHTAADCRDWIRTGAQKCTVFRLPECPPLPHLSAGASVWFFSRLGPTVRR